MVQIKSSCDPKKYHINWETHEQHMLAEQTNVITDWEGSESSTVHYSVLITEVIHLIYNYPI